MCLSACGWLFTSTSHRRTLLGQLHHSKTCTPLLRLILHFAFSASMGASQPYPVSLDTAGCASHRRNGQRGKANSIYTRKSITKLLDIKEAFKSAAWHRAGEAWVSAPDPAGARLGEEPLPLPSHRGGEHRSYLFCGTRRLWLIRKSNWSAELDSL